MEKAKHKLAVNIIISNIRRETATIKISIIETTNKTAGQW